MTGFLTGSLKIPVVTSLPSQATSRGSPTFTDKIFIVRRSLNKLRILALENYRERMQFRRHDTSGNGRIGLHEFSGGGFVRSLKNRNAKCIITRLSRATDQDELTRLNRCLEIGEMPINGRFVLCGPRLVVVKAGREMQYVNELFRFLDRRRTLGRQ